MRIVRSTERIDRRAFGGFDSLLKLTEQPGQHWQRGVRAGMALEKPG